MNISVIIQARMNSQRLPGKVLLDLNGKTVLERIIERIKKSKKIQNIIVATTIFKCDDKIFNLCKKIGVNVYRGDEHDVMQRYIEAAYKFKAKNIIRLTADNPMVDHSIIDSMIQIFETGKYDYISNVYKRTFPDGLDVEIFKTESLIRSLNQTKEKFHREHVTTFIRGGIKGFTSGDFVTFSYTNKTDLSHIRWTLDNEKDYNHIKIFFLKLKSDFSWREALKLEKKIKL